jgi:hypothetical protein
LISVFPSLKDALSKTKKNNKLNSDTPEPRRTTKEKETKPTVKGT